MLHFYRNHRGMTLVEIMIVVAIIGTLMGILGKSVFGGFAKSQVSQTKIQMQELLKALEIYATDCGSFPNEGAGLNALLENPGDCENWGPEPYIKKKMLKDSWNSDFLYVKEGSSYSIISLGKDKQEGGEGLDKDINSSDL